MSLYSSPPAHALVLCCDEKSQVQALDRTQPGLPLKKGRAATMTMTHDYKRNGTTTLFAALNVLNGHVIAQCEPRHRHNERLKLLRSGRMHASPHLSIRAGGENSRLLGLLESGLTPPSMALTPCDGPRRFSYSAAPEPSSSPAIARPYEAREHYSVLGIDVEDALEIAEQTEA